MIASYLKDTAEPEFLANNEKQDAVIRRIEIIGEATAHLSETTRQAVPELPFRRMRGMRNIMAHNYSNVDLKVVWEVGVVHVPQICAALERFFARYQGHDNN